MPQVIVDTRESHLVVVALRQLGTRVVEKMITPGDYVVGEGFAVERKTFQDFVKSIYKKRLFEQLERLNKAYQRCCLVIEGDISHGLANLYNPLIFWGALAKATVEWEIPTVFTVNEEQTAQFIFSLAKKLQEEQKERLAARFKPKFYALADQQRFAVQSLPGIGPKRSHRLLKKFGTVRNVFIAREFELISVEGLGKKQAKEISRFLDSPYLVGNKL